ncbi:hypothetical protein [Actinomadura logoneensis]|uniref:hypothetical protein n=1 Tax=Actinomadura logoneensis TaxID=2293572 RepID=UPI0011C10CE6|nr:hypothetical protein [Actinomadura logoneensis]
MGQLFAGLVDDAALFPPAREPLERALPAYREAAGDAVIGRFLCPASRVAELRTHLLPDDHLDLVVIADTGMDGLPKALEDVAAEPRVRLRGIEVALPEDADQARAATVTIASLPTEVPAFLEVRRTTGWHMVIDGIAAAHEAGATVGAKLRTGGVTADAFPSPAEVAAFVGACVERRLPFKCTAGLHHAVRHTDPETGFVHHGFLNVLLAAADGGSVEDLEMVNPVAVTVRIRALTDEQRETARRMFTGFGSCDIDTPRSDLAALGLL